MPPISLPEGSQDTQSVDGPGRAGMHLVLGVTAGLAWSPQRSLDESYHTCTIHESAGGKVGENVHHQAMAVITVVRGFSRKQKELSSSGHGPRPVGSETVTAQNETIDSMRESETGTYSKV